MDEEEVPNFHWADYLVFFLSLGVSLAVGLFFCISGMRNKATNDDYLMGGRNMNPISVGLSMTASLLNAVFLIGVPAEVYYNGTMYSLIGVSWIIVGVIGALVFVPIFRHMKMTSAYEYLGARFDSVAVRLVGSIVFCASMILFLAVVLYAPSLAFQQATGLSIHLIQLVCGLVCTIYVFLGGLKAVVWTDAIQMLVIIVGTIVIAAVGISEVGGAARVWDLVNKDNRIELNVTDPDPRVRHTIWTQVIGQVFIFLPTYGGNQMMIQRYHAVATTRQAQIAFWIQILAAEFLLAMVVICGLVMYANFVDCDPLLRGTVTKPDQVFPLLLMRLLGQYHGLPGLYTAAVFAASLSSVSSAVNSLAAVFMADFIQPLYRHINKKDIVDKHATYISRGLCLFFGLLTIGLSYIAPFMGDAIVQIPLTIWGVVGAPLFGMFVLAIFFPCANAVGTICGVIVSLFFSFWLAIGGIYYGRKTPPKTPLGLACCFPPPVDDVTLYSNFSSTTEWSTETTMYSNMTEATPTPWVSPCTFPTPVNEEQWDLREFYSISYAWYGLINLLVCVIVGLLVSLISDGCYYGCKEKGSKLSPELLYDCGGKCFCYCPNSVQDCCRCAVNHDHDPEDIPVKITSADNGGLENPAFSNMESKEEETKY